MCGQLPLLRLLLTALLLSIAGAIPTATALAQQTADPAGDATPLPTIIGPPAPVAPATITRDDKGGATVRAVRISTPLILDGKLDEAVYETVQAASGFIQQVPVSGVPATEQTELWVLFDDQNLYIAARCLDSQPEREIATELRRDDSGLVQNESLSVVLDTFYDRRNGFTFQTGPLGTIRDQAIVDGQLTESWNTVWYVKSARSEIGWTTELAIPFKSLRYAGVGPQIWGLNVRRIVKWKNEFSFLTGVPAAYGSGAVNRLNVAGTLVGIETPLQSKNLELKPYVTASLVTDRAAAVRRSNDPDADVGFDFKYGLTRGLIADVTVNTDFAQVEEDLQQVNLTRFSLFFPEKREFFLEGQGIFAFGGAQASSAGFGISRDIPILFFSRQIGLSAGQAVPVVVGGRVTGRSGPFTIGALNIQTGELASAGAPSTNFSVVRLKRDILRRSNVGVIATNRNPSGTTATNSAAGLDANFGFFDALNISGYYALTTAATGNGSRASYRALLAYAGDRYGAEIEHLAIGADFKPEVGYVRRTDFRRTHGQLRFSPRTPRSRLVRKLSWEAEIDYVENEARTLVQNRGASGRFDMEFNSGDSLYAEYLREYEFVPRAFAISPGVIVPPGGYDYGTLRLSYNVGQQRKVSGRVIGTFGSFYGDGTRREASYSGYIGLNKHLGFEPNASLAWVTLPFGEFTARVVSVRTIVTPTPRMMLSGLTQFNAASHSLSSSVRLRWEYRPGSELFVVYSDGRDTVSPGFPNLVNRSFTVKVTRLLRF
ncbi:MAG: DUF5916 domain-containing protein [Vicinamibacterales bacterium]